MKKLLLTFLLVVISMLFLVNAAETEDNSSAITEIKEGKNITYGQCVSASAKVKNDCYASVKEVYDLCKTNATDTKQCKSDYKPSKNECKKTFKAGKKECSKIKHNFIDTIKYSFA